jgi:hypothetical protein
MNTNVTTDKPVKKVKAEKSVKTEKAVKAEKAVKEIVMPEDNAAQYTSNEELKLALSGGKALTSKVVKVKQASASKLREGFPAFLHLLPINATRALAFIWDTREITEAVDLSQLTEEDMVSKVKDSGLPLRIAADSQIISDLF